MTTFRELQAMLFDTADNRWRALSLGQSHLVWSTDHAQTYIFPILLYLLVQSNFLLLFNCTLQRYDTRYQFDDRNEPRNPSRTMIVGDSMGLLLSDQYERRGFCDHSSMPILKEDDDSF